MEMKEAAEAYCRVIEAARGAERSTFANEVAMSLSAVVAAAYRLPDVDLDSSTVFVGPGEPISHARWFSRMKDIQSVLEDWDNYWTTHDAYYVDETTGLPDFYLGTLEEKVANLSLADDLADIWRDLQNGLDSLSRGMTLKEVTWDWRLTFGSHWGAHATEALRAIHQQVTD
ncbi:DUF5063 domain-containing protein [Frondihabitans cladoniiphilus]|uniref:DUF5063 domain-containing protein n=1 Tax=Frondihabitans cladoniiphilus TaxID=715785 RepID=A0ABP8VNJ1_9MICO